MKILHLCTYREGGAGEAASRLNHGLREIGQDSILCTKLPSLSEDHISATTSGAKKWYASQSPRFEYHLARLFWPKVRPVLTRDLLPSVARKVIREINPDIINLHWINHGLVSATELRWLADHFPLVWTLHDLTPLSGGIGYREEAGLNEGSFGRLTFNDSRSGASNQLLERRKKALKRASLSVVAPSGWMAAEAKKSPAFSGHKIHHIPNGINLSVFRPLLKSGARMKLSLPVDRPILLFGADTLSSRRKGGKHLQCAIKIADDMWPSNVMKPLLMLFGGERDEKIKFGDWEICSFGRIKDQEFLVQLYSAANVFVCPSREDNLPNTVIESLSCGTPVVGFSIGGMPDLVKNDSTGKLVEPFDERALAKALVQLLTLSEDARQRISQNCRDSAIKSYSDIQQAGAYVAVYEDLVLKFGRL